MGIKKYYIVVVLIALQFSSQAQMDTSYVYQFQEEKLMGLFKSMHEAKDKEGKLLFNDTIRNILLNELKQIETFEYAFDSLENMGKITSPDKVFRIYNWNLPVNESKHLYYTILQFYNNQERTCKLVELIDNQKEIQHFEQAKVPHQYWYGGLYYDIIPEKIDGKIFYTLLALDFNDLFTTKKIIDVMSFTDDFQFITFGHPIFQNEKKQLQHRLVFEYSARVSMSIRYNEELKMLVFDHLSPTKPSLQGKYQFYGPDFSYDALRFKKGIWYYESDVDVRNMK